MISIIMSTYKEEETLLRESIESILKSTTIFYIIVLLINYLPDGLLGIAGTYK